MNKKIGIPIIIFLLILIGLGIFVFYKNFSNSPPQTNYETNKTSGSEELNNNENENNAINNNSTENSTNNTYNESSTQQNTNNNVTTSQAPAESKPPVETQVATFSTNIYSQDSARQNNIQVTCNKLNGTIVKKGATFSFCGTIGPSTSSKGYQEADIYDNNGKKKKGYGGGNCQISSTLYNAVLATPNLVVTERHPHSNHVPYVKKDKDAAVAYGSYDFKFRNDTGSDIKILASATSKLVTVTLNKIEY